MIGVDFMKCEWCGKEINDGERFCSTCKAAIKVPKRQELINEAEEQIPESKSVVSILLKIIGVIIIFVGVLSLLLDIESWLKIPVLISAIISGLFLFGFGVLIKILLAIKDKLNLIYLFLRIK